MRRSLPAKPRLLELVEAHKASALRGGPDVLPASRWPRIETALEVKFRTVEYLLEAMDFLAGAAARRRSQRRRGARTACRRMTAPTT